jgi:hypothetical protein
MVAAEWRKVGNPAARCARAIPTRSNVGHSTSRRSTIGIQRRFVFFGEDEIVWAVAKLLKWRGDRYRVIDTMSAFLCWRDLFAWSLLQPILGLPLHSSAGNI